MKLRPWIEQRGLTVQEFADLVERSEATVIRWLNRTRHPRHDDMRKIYRVTQGAVRPDDLVLLPEDV